MSGPFGKLWQIGMKAEQFTAFGQEGFRAVGEKAEMVNSHKPTRKNMKQESADEFLDWELSDLELIPVFSIAVSEGDLAIVG